MANRVDMTADESGGVRAGEAGRNVGTNLVSGDAGEFLPREHGRNWQREVGEVTA